MYIYFQNHTHIHAYICIYVLQSRALQHLQLAAHEAYEESTGLVRHTGGKCLDASQREASFGEGGPCQKYIHTHACR